MTSWSQSVLILPFRGVPRVLRAENLFIASVAIATVVCSSSPELHGSPVAHGSLYARAYLSRECSHLVWRARGNDDRDETD